VTSQVEVVIGLENWSSNWWYAEVTLLVKVRRRGCHNQDAAHSVTVDLLRELGREARYAVRRDISPNKLLHVKFTEEEITWLKLKYA
jgi:hypothetical protein